MYHIVFNPVIYTGTDARGGFPTEYEDREEGGKAKGKEGAHGVWGEGGGTGCKM